MGSRTCSPTYPHPHIPATTWGAGSGTPGARPRPAAPRTSRGRGEGQGTRRVMPETEPSTLPANNPPQPPLPPAAGPGPRRPVSQSAARRGWRVAAPARLVPGSGRRRARELGAEGREGVGCGPGGRRGARGRVAGHALTSTRRGQREPEQQERLHAAPQIHAAPRRPLQPWPGAPRRGEARAAGRACVRARSSRGSRAAPQAGQLPRSLAASSPAAGAAPPSWPRLAALGTEASSFQEAGCSAAASNCPGPRLPARMLPAHSRGCIL